MVKTIGRSAAKRAANVSVRSELLDAARAAGINLSATLEDALRLKLKATHAHQWRSENRAAIANYNDYVELHGVFSDGSRKF
ncbi:MAG: type II toxin-antitoxin system CcdA family antitoxin [Steroidobacteraceae bacterium]